MHLTRKLKNHETVEAEAMHCDGSWTLSHLENTFEQGWMSAAGLASRLFAWSNVEVSVFVPKPFASAWKSEDFSFQWHPTALPEPFAVPLVSRA